MTVAGETPVADVQRSARQASVVESKLSALANGGIATFAPPPSAPSGRAEFDRRPHGHFNTESYEHLDENGFKRVAADPLSTFSVDVDTASYANVRRFLNEGRLPEPGAVRIEELINYFRLPYAGAGRTTSRSPSRRSWRSARGIRRTAWRSSASRAARCRRASRPPRNLVFLLDVSGSMTPPDKLPLVQSAMRMLVDALDERDRVAIVVYAGASGLVLPSTPGTRQGHDRPRDRRAAKPGGSTNGAAGIQLAYQVAREHFIRGGVNRVILATDGDFNVGVTSQDALVRLIEREARSRGVFLSVLGVGTGNLKDSTMEKLADKGNGNYAYLDSLHEARKVLVARARRHARSRSPRT